MEDIEHYDIPVYNFPYDVEEDDEETIQDNSELRVCDVIESKPVIYVNDTGATSFCHHRFGGGNRDGRATGTRQDIPLGYCGSRQPKTF